MGFDNDHLGTFDAVRGAVHPITGKPRKAMCPVWTAPLVKGFVEALRTSRARSCLRPVDAEWMAPLALMIGPHGPSPPSPYRARTGADTCTGFQAYPRVHITSSAPSI